MNDWEWDTAPIELETGSDPCATIIWLHGLGADGNDFVPIAEALPLPVPVRYVFPHAPHRAVTLNAGFVMRAWYDLNIGARGFKQDVAHIEASTRAVTDLVAREQARGIAANRCVLAGFSQGGLIAFRAALALPQPIGGVMALSAPIADAAAVIEAAAPSVRTTPIFLAHGVDDAMVPVAMARAANESLARAGANVSWHEYPMAHSVCAEEVQDIAAWLAPILR